MKQLFVAFLIIVSSAFARTWSSYTSIGIEPFAKDSVLYLGFGKDSIEILKNIDNYEGLYIDYHIWYFYDSGPEPIPESQYSFSFTKTTNYVQKDSIWIFLRWTNKENFSGVEVVSIDSVKNYQIDLNDFEVCDVGENPCSIAFIPNGFASKVDTLTIKRFSVPSYDYKASLIDVVAEISSFIYKKGNLYNAMCYTFSFDFYEHVVLSCQYQDDGTLNFDKMIPIKREDILKVYASSINPNKIKTRRMKPTLLNKKESDTFLINGIRKKNNSSNVIIKNQTPVLQLR